MPVTRDGPASPIMRPLKVKGNLSLDALAGRGVSEIMVENAGFAPTGDCVSWGIPFETDNIVFAKGGPVTVDLGGVKSRWLVFMHGLDLAPSNRPETYLDFGGTMIPIFKQMQVEHAADYVFVYSDGSEARVTIKRRHHIGAFTASIGDSCFEAVSQFKPMHSRSGGGDFIRNQNWGWLSTETLDADIVRMWINWLWAWENPHPEKKIEALRIEPVDTAVLVFGITAADVAERPIRWRTRKKALLKLPDGETHDPSTAYHGTEGVLAEELMGGFKNIKMDMGQIISVLPRPVYPNADWAATRNNATPEVRGGEVLVEYASHPDAHFHLSDGTMVPVAELEANHAAGPMKVIAPADRPVRFRAVDKKTGHPIAVKLHVHGEAGEYLPPRDRHRVPNPYWFQDYSVDYTHKQTHFCNYIDGEAEILLPRGRVYVEVSKGFEVAPLRRVFDIGVDRQEIVIELDNVLDWRSKGWVTADTHVHFLSPQTALLEGAAEGVNVVNLLASQWGELFTNVGDFDGKTTYGSIEAGGDGEYLVRVGTENRQSPLGHISLIGYENEMILPLCSDGPSEAAMGDPVNALLTDWAARCKAQNGTVVVPHFPIPDGEHAAAILSGNVDAIELTSLMEQAVGGLSSYALADWYRYLNCGYFVAAAGGTDKMSADIAVGRGRTYAKLDDGEPFTFAAWQRAMARGQTFVTMGPLVDMTVDGHPPGARMEMSSSGGTVDVVWSVESVIIPVTSVDLIVNGEVRESQAIDTKGGLGHWRLKIGKSSWAALLVRAHDPDHGAVIGAHTSPVMMALEGSDFMAAADAISILDQIENALAYFDTIGTRADVKNYKRLRLMLTSVHRGLHNRLHAVGIHHDHNVVADHKEHH